MEFKIVECYYLVTLTERSQLVTLTERLQLCKAKQFFKKIR